MHFLWLVNVRLLISKSGKVFLILKTKIVGFFLVCFFCHSHNFVRDSGSISHFNTVFWTQLKLDKGSGEFSLTSSTCSLSLLRCILGELFTKKPIFQANQELLQLELIR